MSVEVEISPVFKVHTNNILNIKTEGKTVRECLHDLVRQFPKLKRILLDKDGNLMQAYDFYINGENLYPKDMNKQLNDGDKLAVVYVFQGG